MSVARNDRGSTLAVSPADAARLAGVGRTFIYEEIKAGRLASLKIGKRRLIKVEELNRWLDRHAA